ncbi:MULTISPECIES: helix-turn-helix transcriptional regulator [unclassified Dehalobacter]|jgi:hypothetical protein|uniref:helix-turn-helix domain-containing protein n=1 Tax=unclassified Dehalobacter TaxID=2635733 RepID=UPI00028B8E6E|nr:MULTISPECIES: helix-turn-helix transcriptional regulator [unclassified Dehalobacter]AFV02841.1 hypothetical protein DHBDCA_p1815 [Dehalobacter sp. DCA]AFV05828.1 hypothetical protein DCF50_p1826 [Dehalobacter sp. CF]
MKVYERIQNYLRNNGLKQKHVADKAGYTEKQFSAMMTGRRKIFSEDYIQICNVLHVPVTAFIPE